jgi:23S rRNA pseudouridine1911/1915/1917 synthase
VSFFCLHYSNIKSQRRRSLELSHHKTFESIQQSVIVEESSAGKRLDQILAEMFPDYSRSQLQKWLKQKKITVDGALIKGKQKLIGGETIRIDLEIESQTGWTAEDIPLTIVYEDNTVIVINKPVGMVVHPGAGNTSGTLSNALLHHFPDIESVPRAGIVHRLDKDTSGLLVAAKTLKAHTSLVEQLQNRTVTREYEAITTGVITAGSTINQPIGRNPHHRTRMAVSEFGKPAITHFNVLEKYRGHTRIRCKLKTGRTHQIRVHMQFLNAPLLGDQTYNVRLRIPNGADQALIDALRQFKRQALHAYKLAFIHPETGKEVSFTAKPPEDMQQLIAILRQDVRSLYNLDEDDDEGENFEHNIDW